MEHKAILSNKELLVYLSIGRTMLHYKRDPHSEYFDANFPKPVRLGARRIGFKRAEIDSWVENLSKVA